MFHLKFNLASTVIRKDLTKFWLKKDMNKENSSASASKILYLNSVRRFFFPYLSSYILFVFSLVGFRPNKISHDFDFLFRNFFLFKFNCCLASSCVLRFNVFHKAARIHAAHSNNSVPYNKMVQDQPDSFFFSRRSAFYVNEYFVFYFFLRFLKMQL